METRATLPVSVLVPTRNSMSMLPEHIDTLRQLKPLAKEIIVVDSESSDGTIELLRREFSQARFLSHPPGLYESWNFGVNACATEFVYVSTVGDAISAEGLQRLVRAATDLRCDVVISPPKLIDEHGKRLEKSWPIIELLQSLKLQRDAALESEQVLLFAFTFMRKSILGSSASNIYRTDYLRARPFPTDLGHAGDVGWGLRHCGEIRLGIVPEEISTFVLHARAKKIAANRDALRVAAARESLARVREYLSSDTSGLAQQLCDAWERWFAAQACREGDRLWLLRASGWRERHERNTASDNLKRLQGEALARIEQSLRA